MKSRMLIAILIPISLASCRPAEQTAHASESMQSGVTVDFIFSGLVNFVDSPDTDPWQMVLLSDARLGRDVEVTPNTPSCKFDIPPHAPMLTIVPPPGAATTSSRLWVLDNDDISVVPTGNPDTSTMQQEPYGGIKMHRLSLTLKPAFLDADSDLEGLSELVGRVKMKGGRWLKGLMRSPVDFHPIKDYSGTPKHQEEVAVTFIYRIEADKVKLTRNETADIEMTEGTWRVYVTNLPIRKSSNRCDVESERDIHFDYYYDLAVADLQTRVYPRFSGVRSPDDPCSGGCW